MDTRTKERFATLAKQARFHGAFWSSGHEDFSREQVDQCALLAMDASTRFRRWVGDPDYEQPWKEAFWAGWQIGIQARREGRSVLDAAVHDA